MQRYLLPSISALWCNETIQTGCRYAVPDLINPNKYYPITDL